MIYMGREEREELKVGCLLEVEPEPNLDGKTGDLIELGHTRQASCVSYLGG